MARREELTVRFNDEERAAIDQRAEVDGVSAAAVLRALVRRHLMVSGSKRSERRGRTSAPDRPARRTSKRHERTR